MREGFIFILIHSKLESADEAATDEEKSEEILFYYPEEKILNTKARFFVSTILFRLRSLSY